MTDTVASARAVSRAGSQYFYFQMAIACAATAFLGFAPTYWMGMASGAFKARPIVHIHGILYFSWTLYYLFQTWLAASGQVARHRSVGLIGVSFATAMVIFGMMTAIGSMRNAAAFGPAGVVAAEAFDIVPIVGLVYFAGCIILALTNLRRPEWHKRLMLLAAVSILAAPIARWFFIFVPALGHPPMVSAALAPALTAFLLIVVAMAHDWRTRGQPHQVYVVGGVIFVLINILQLPVSNTQAWHATAHWISGLAG